MKKIVTAEINGEPREALADTRDTLLEFLRDRLGQQAPRKAAATATAGRARCCWMDSSSAPA